MRKYFLIPALFVALLPVVASAAPTPFVGQPKTQAELLRCEVVKSKYSGKIYKKGDKAIKAMAAKWALCLAPEVPKTSVAPVAPQKTAAQIQLETEARNLALYGNPLGRVTPTQNQNTLVVRAQTPDTLTLVDGRNFVSEERAREIAREEAERVESTRLEQERRAREDERNRVSAERAAAAPKIIEFSTDKTSVGLGGEVTYTWDSLNTKGCTLSTVLNPGTISTLRPSKGSEKATIEIYSQTDKLPFNYEIWLICEGNDGSRQIRWSQVEVTADIFDGEVEKTKEYLTPYYQVTYQQKALNGYSTQINCSASDPEWGKYQGSNSSIRVGDVNGRSVIPGLRFDCKIHLIMKNWQGGNRPIQLVLSQDGTPITKEFSFTIPET